MSAAAAAPLAPALGRGRIAPALALMGASGFAGLGWQLVWTQQASTGLGHDVAAVLAVVAAFFAGLALGAGWLGTRAERSPRPLAWYAASEVAIAAWGLLLALLMPAAGAWMLALTGVQPSPAWQWSVAFGGTFALLLPATAAMGATLPALARAVDGGRQAGTSVAGLYAGNSAGAVAGVLATAFWLVPAFGLVRTAFVCAALNLACAVMAFPALTPSLVGTAEPRTRPARGKLMLLAATGLLGIGYEVVVVRVLSQLSEKTVYTYALLLAVYLSGSALGAACWRRLRGRPADDLRAWLLLALAAACVAGTALLGVADAARAWLLHRTPPLAAEALLALAAFGPATVAMGAVFSHLASGGAGFGRALAANTAGAAAAPLLFGVLLVPAIGPQHSLLLIAAGYAALVVSRRLRRGALLGAAGIAVAIAALAVMAPLLAFVDVPDGGRVVSYRDGVAAAVSVVEDADGVARLRIDNRQQEGSSATRLVDARQALLPLLLHPGPRRALFLGLGTGVTAASATLDPALEVDAVELLPEVVDASRRFIAPNPRLHVLTADARRLVRASGQRWDLIVADNFHPARSGSAMLYTVEHFAAVRDRLAPGGLFCQWLPLHQLDAGTLRSIVRSFLAAFPHAGAVLASNSLQTPVLGLIATRDGGAIDAPRVQTRLAAAAHWPEPPGSFGFSDAMAVLGSVVAGPVSLQALAGDAALNTDDRPIVAYRAPQAVYAPQGAPAGRLVELLHATTIAPGELFGGLDAATARRLAAYRAARLLYIEAGRGVRPQADPAAMLRQLRAPLLAVLRASPDFRPAYDPLLRIGLALAASDPAQARSLLTELAAIQPDRPEAADALHHLNDPQRITTLP